MYGTGTDSPAYRRRARRRLSQGEAAFSAIKGILVGYAEVIDG